MLELGVDEITMVLQIPAVNKKMLSVSDWKDVAEYMISKFEKQSDIKTVFGSRNIEKKAPAGYTVAYTYGQHEFYFAIAYHDYQISMGVVVKFSAQALDYYLESTDLNVYEFLQKAANEKAYETKLSRIDLTADYINEQLDLSKIYQDMMDEKISVFREHYSIKKHSMEYRRVPMNFKAIVGDEVETIYVGSPKSNARLRIYDKRIEQIIHKGNKLAKAKAVRDWIRFEGVFRHLYARQISEALMKIKNEGEFANLISLTLYQKFFIMNSLDGVAQSPTKYTQMLIDCVNNNNFRLKAPLTRNYELSRSISHIFKGAGVLSTLYRVKEIWGIESVSYLLEYIVELLENDSYCPNQDSIYWLRHNMLDYRKNYSTFDQFVQDNLSLLMYEGGAVK